MENRELGMCEKVKTRKFTRLSAVSVKTLKKTIRRTSVHQEEAVWKEGWVCYRRMDRCGTHFVAIIGITKLGKILLRFATLPNEADMSADAIIKVIDDVFDIYRIEAAQLCFFICDHASVNVAIARKTHSVNKKPQTSSVPLLDVQALFDHVVKHNPSTSTQLSTNSWLVKFPYFKNSVVKVLAGKVRTLFCTEKAAVAKLHEEKGFAEAVLFDEAPSPSVVDLKWVRPTSNDVERLFSRAGNVYSRLHRSLNPMTLETKLFLQYNRSM
ncbi:hypothetical protein GQ600_1842 [Phytophthora cactorum]|nr:hypothetical protein GQ600_1842 [Phytophthora cactorum]